MSLYTSQPISLFQRYIIEEFVDIIVIVVVVRYYNISIARVKGEG